MVKKFLIILATVALFASSVSAQPFRGVSSFAVMHPEFPCDKLMEAYEFARDKNPKFLPALSILWGTFGEEESCVKWWAYRFADRPHVIEVHFSNGPGRRNGQLAAEGEFFPEWSVKEYNRRLETGDFVALGGIHYRMLRIEEFARRVENANTRWLISWELESNLSVRAAQMWEAHYRTLVALGLLRDFALVANPHSPRHFGGAQFREFHSLRGKPSGAPNCVANEDGAYDQSPGATRAFFKRYAGCVVQFLWRGEHQGRTKGGSFISPRKREFVIEDTDGLAELLAR